MLELEPDQLDVAVNYEDPAAGEFVTLYIYRHVAGSLPVWFDRSIWMIEHRDVYGAVTPLSLPQAVALPGQQVQSGLASVYGASGKGLRSTAITLLPVGEFLVKLRLSSRDLSPEQMSERMRAVMAEIKWPKRLAPTSPAVPISACATDLSVGSEAKPVQDDLSAGLVDAVLGLAVASQSGSSRSSEAPATWCRDRTQLDMAAVYRANESRDAYLIAYADAGRAASVTPSAGAALLAQAESNGKSTRSWAAAMHLPAQDLRLPNLDRLPPPQQLYELINAGRFSSTVPTWGKSKTITINSVD